MAEMVLAAVAAIVLAPICRTLCVAYATLSVSQTQAAAQHAGEGVTHLSCAPLLT